MASHSSVDHTESQLSQLNNPAAGFQSKSGASCLSVAGLPEGARGCNATGRLTLAGSASRGKYPVRGSNGLGELLMGRTTAAAAPPVVAAAAAGCAASGVTVADTAGGPGAAR